MKPKIIATALTFGALSATALADVKLDDHLTFSGWAIGAYMNYKPSPGDKVDGFFDASKPIPGGGDSNNILARLTANYKPVTAVASINWFPKLSANEVSLLDAYATLDVGNGFSLTGGKFLSYLGYESFYPALMDQITYANGDFLAPIPGYHSGGRLDFTSKEWSFGVAGVDSVYSPKGPTRGDGEIKHNGGVEAFVSYTGIENLTVWGGVAHDTKGGFEAHDVTTIDLWASYQLTKAARAAIEFVNKDGGTGNSGSNWLMFFNYAFDDHVSSTFRLSGEEMDDGGPKFTKFTISPTYAFNANVSVRAEYSHYEYRGYSANSAEFWGVQAVIKW